MANFELKEDNRDEVMGELKTALELALQAVGIEAQGDVSLACPVDTGLLRNSITYAVEGHPPATKSYMSNSSHANTAVTQAAGTAGKPIDPPKSGSYDGGAVSSGDGEKKVYIGTNVEYAP